MPISQSTSTNANIATNNSILGNNTTVNGSVSQYGTLINGLSSTATGYSTIGNVVTGTNNTASLNFSMIGNARNIQEGYNTINSGGYGGSSTRFCTPANRLLTDFELQPNTEYYLTTNATGLEWQSIAPVNEDEITIDITKATVEIYDFTKKKVIYDLKQFKTKYISDKEINCVLVERDVLPGELKQLKESKNVQEVLLEFECYSDDERYGKQYVSKAIDWNFIGGGLVYNDFPITTQVQPMTIGDGLISVQPLTAPVGDLWYIDPVYTTTNPIYGNGTTVTGIANTDGFPQGLASQLDGHQTYTIGNIQTVMDDTVITI